MKRLMIMLLLGVALAAPLQAEEEIVIEMTGQPSAAAEDFTLWDKTAPQLTRQLRGKTREQVLYAVPVVSDKDRIISARRGEYALVEYYRGNDFRKLLFQAESPQTFVTAAATAADVLAVNKKYGVNIGLTEKAFTDFYPSAQQQDSPYLSRQAALYRLSYTDINTPQAVERWFLFERGNLTQTFETSGTKNAYLEALKRQQEAAQQPQPAQAAAAPAQNRVVRKALISGGTEWDKATLPRVVNPKPLLITPTQSADNKQK